MKRAGFTMIELIFVIVILGILAAVAVPKLAATRSDAAATAVLSDYKAAVKTITADAMAKGTMPTLNTLFTTGGNYVATSATVLTISPATGVTCATLTATATTLTPAFTTTDARCALLAGEQTTAIQVLGSAVTR